MVAPNITWHSGEVSPYERTKLFGHRSACLWFTGLSGSGKSTLARRVERRLVDRSVVAYVLDGDNVRYGLNADLGFAAEDRKENIRRVGQVARLMVDSGVIVLAAFISPYRVDRAQVRALFDADAPFVEVHVAAPLHVCESRDPKGLYKKARRGELTGFTGIDAPYEAPEAPELFIDTGIDTGAAELEASADQVIAWLDEAGLLKP